MSVCVLGCAPKFSINLLISILTHYFSLGIHSCIVYILLFVDSLYPLLHSALSITVKTEVLLEPR